MPAAQWLLQNDRPVIEIILSVKGHDLVRTLVADTGAGDQRSSFQLLLEESLCRQTGGVLIQNIQLGGAYSGSFPVYLVKVRIPLVNFDEPVPVVGVSKVPTGFDGIAGFSFLNRFHYGNFGNPDYFGLDPIQQP
jgi:hypothetical protein